MHVGQKKVKEEIKGEKKNNKSEGNTLEKR